MGEERKNEIARIVLLGIVLILLVTPAMAVASTQVHVVKYANDAKTILNETTVDFHWMEANLPIYGDGVTHYYMQGPVFNASITDKWNPEENDPAILTKDFGAVKGTDVKDLCNLVGGMSSGDNNITLLASDGFSKTFAYSSIYNPPARAGPSILTWYRADQGYVDGSYSTGMRNVIFADSTTNPWGEHVFGLWDMHEAFPEAFWYCYQPGQPSATGLSVQNIDRIFIYSNDPAPTAIDTLFDGAVALTPGETFTKQAYNNVTGGLYTINRTTPLGALDTVATMQGLTVNVTDKRWSLDQDLLLDDIGKYLNKKPNIWYAYVNGVYKDGYGNHANGLNVIELANNDQVNFFYAPNKDPNPSLNATAVIKIKVDIHAPGPVVDTLYNGTITLTPGETFTKQAYNNLTGGLYTINRTTPLGALDIVAGMQGLTVNVTDKRWSYDQDLLLDDIGKYLNKKPNTWYTYINGVYRDGYGNHANGLNVIELANNDQVNFYYAPSKDPNPVVNATAVIRIKVNVQSPGPVVDTLFDGPVTLTPGETFAKQAYNNLTGGLYTINRTTPLGALDTVAGMQGLTVNVTDKRWSYDQDLLLDDIGKYLNKKPNTWYTYINGVYRDGYGNHANGLNVIELANNDQVNFYYAPSKDPNPVVNATAVVKIKVNVGGQPSAPDWTLSLSGAKNSTVSKTLFEQGLACTSSGHQVFWNDTDGNTWGGVPLWVLVSMVDDNPDIGPDHFNFNDSIAAQGYSVKVISGDGWDTTLASKDIARNNSYIVANTLNGQPVSLLTPGGKRSWPLHLKGAAVFGGQQVGNITRIELSGLPQPATEWKLALEGDVTDTVSQSYFIEAIASHHNVTWTDPSNGNVWEGMALWDLVGAVDDIEFTNHFTFNDTRAAANYTIRVAASDFFADFYSTVAAHNNGYIVAYKKNGAPLTGTSAPLQLVGPATTNGKQRVGNVSKISLIGLPDQFPPGLWQLKLNGKIGDTIPQGEFEYSADCHDATYTDTAGNVYTGIPLWRLLGWVDDRIPHGPDGFDDAAAIAGYKVIVKAGDGYAKEFTSQQIGKNNDFIVANTMNGIPLPTDGSHPPYPLRLVGNGATGGNSVGNVAEIQLTDFQTPTEAPKLHILKYGTDGVTVINETYVDYYYMESSMPVIGDGTTAYKFEGLTLNPANLWDPEETYPGGFKISNVVKGTRVHDLAELVGGMDSGTTVTFVAVDGFETTLPYSSIYTNPAVQARQGDAFIAWWGDGKYVPAYVDGMRLFFTSGEDHVYGQWDMNQTLPPQYYRYNFQDNIQYPSAAGLSAKYIATIKVYSTPETDWTLQLDGRDIGGLAYNVSKPFLEEALGCQFGADHKATYTDNKGRAWEGMPLWFFAGFVDDADQHSPNAYNVTKALAGYNIVVTGKDGYSATIPGKDIIRSSNYLIANSLNGTHIDEVDENWPLRLTGANVTGSMTVKGVTSIKLMKITKPVANFTAIPTSGTVPLSVQFDDQSTGTGPFTYAWDFNNDGIVDNSTWNPAYTYSSIGIYTVNLTVTNSAGSSSQVKAGYITVNPDQPDAGITVTSPNGGETWTRGTTPTITWSSTGSVGSYVKVELLKSGTVVQNISLSTPNDGKFASWTIPNTFATGTDYRIRISSTTNPTITDTSDSNFTIKSGTSSSSITVISPNNGENWILGTTPKIAWTSSGNVGSQVQIELLKDGTVVQNISLSTPNDGTFASWTIPNTFATGTDYRIRISSSTNPAITDTSDSNFAIIGKASIMVTTPSGGENWFRGTTPKITWTSTGSVGSYVKIELLKANAVVQDISLSTPNDGTFTSWAIPNTFATGTDYRIRITSTTNPAITDMSYSNFAISSKSSIMVTSPDGSENWVRGTTPKITWTSTGSVGSYVKIELLKAGTVVQNITLSTPNDGTFASWTIPNTFVTGTDYRLRISSASNPAITDTSDSNFAISSSSSITVAAPNGGETWIKGTAPKITWTSTGSVGSYVKIELLKAGVVVQNISLSTPNDGTFTSWTIPNSFATGTDYKIRITSTSNSAYNDTSNANFIIH